MFEPVCYTLKVKFNTYIFKNSQGVDSKAEEGMVNGHFFLARLNIW